MSSRRPRTWSSPVADHPAIPSAASAHLDRAGIGVTRQRYVVVVELVQGGGHVTLADLLVRIQARDPRVSTATVYRVLKLLVACGFAAERRFARTTRYEVCIGREDHDHLLCIRCGEICEFREPRLEALGRAVAERLGYADVRGRLELYGVCGRCRANGTATPDA